MAILKIARMGHPVLGGVAEPVADPRDPALRDFVDDMIETLIDADGAGLAAPQVHVPLRVVLVSAPRGRGADHRDEGGEEGEGAPLTALINPVITPIGAETVESWEACLSLPGLTGRVPRFAEVRYRYLTLEGLRVEGVARGFHARVLQHECDHLDGVLYPMRMTDLSTFGFVAEVRRADRFAVDGDEGGDDDDAGDGGDDDDAGDDEPDEEARAFAVADD